MAESLSRPLTPPSPVSLMEQTAGASRLQVCSLGLDDSSAWNIVEGRIRHRTGRFFEIGAITYERTDGQRAEQPIIFQPEIGTLGFLIHRDGGATQVLVNAKVEPGNVNTCQLAPSCQATLSNQQRVHGGAPTPCNRWFLDPSPDAVLSDTLQSEQGTRFWRKLNRNISVVLSDGQRDELHVPPTHAWTDLDDVLALLPHDFALNTDARSVLVTCDWATLAGRTPFVRHRTDTPLGTALYRSFYEAPDAAEEVAEALNRLAAARKAPPIQASRMGVEALANWYVATDGLYVRVKGPFNVRHYQIEVEGREVSTWDQPFVQSHGPGSITLCCAPVEGVPRFLFRLSREVGLASGIELTPALCTEPGTTPAEAAASDPVVHQLLDWIEREGTTWMASEQSEEGGRFFRDVNRYRIVGLPSPPDVLPSDYVWLSLQAVQRLVRHEQVFTNEARSALSLLLTYL